MKIAIFGGSFDPVHNEHINMTLEAKKAFGIDQIFVLPALLPPHRLNEKRADFIDRFTMLTLAFKDYSFIRVDDYEGHIQGTSYTYVTLKHYAELYPDSQLYFILGTDMLEDFPTWKNTDEILKCATLLVTPREGDNLEKAKELYDKQFSKKLLISPYFGKNISSTRIKSYLKLDLSVEQFMPQCVISYISHKKVYEPDELYSYVRAHLPEKRRRHTANVIIKAVAYAKRLKLDKKKAEIAALLHDCAKYANLNDFPNFACEAMPKQIVHQYLGEYVARNVLKVDDEEILSAIKFHTTGRPQMTILEKVIFLADLLEEDRDFEGVEAIRNAVDVDFEKGFRFAVNELVKFLKNGQEEIYPLTLECANYYNK